MIANLTAALSFVLAAQAGDGWVWTFYDGDGMAVLAREVPDTDRLSAVFECTPGSGVARLTVYGPSERPEFVNVSAGDVSADAERVESDGLAMRLRLDHPLFLAFADGEPLTLTAGEEMVSTPAPRSAVLARFRDACGGAA